MKMIKVALFEDKADLREGLQAFLESSDEVECVGAWENCDQVKKIVTHYLPDVVLMDIDMPGTDGMQGLKIIKELYPQMSVIMLTIFEDDENVFNSICAGANGYMLKRTPPDKIIEAIRDVHEGGAPMTASIARKVLQAFAQTSAAPKQNDYRLTDREKDILGSLVKGNSYKMISAELNISINTVREYIRRIYDKLHVHSMNEAVSKAINNKIV
jgi:DNA-binding NarL/FixJ family response regulator